MFFRAFLPCLPTSVKVPPIGSKWVFEIKHDGFRLIARRIGGDVRLFTRTGFDVSGRYTLVAEALRRLKVLSVVLDGEVCCNTFDDLWSRKHDHAARLLAFDLLELDGVDYRLRPLMERKAELERLLAKENPGLQLVEHLTGDGAVIFEHACKLGLEGIVAKRADRACQAGRSKRWLKIKNRAHPSVERVRAAFSEPHRQSRASSD
jgi:bifunctional non-homologous end joining protein LigD